MQNILVVIGRKIAAVIERLNTFNQRLEAIEVLLFPNVSDIDGGGADAHLVTDKVVDGGAVIISGYFTEINGGNADL